jgi:extracellular elastinolytic metalloproteinase
VYLRQIQDGEDVAGADATVNIQDGVVVHSGSRFVDPSEISGSQELSPEGAVAIARGSVRSEDAEVVSSPVLLYRVLDDGTARLAYDVQVETARHWWNISVDAENGRVVHRFDYVDSENAEDIAARTARSEDVGVAQEMVAAIGPPEQAIDGSSYHVFAIPLESPNDGSRRTVYNPADADASPFGWHDTNGVKGPESTLTTGNNVDAYADTMNRDEADPESRPDGGSGLDFHHLIPTYDATPAIYRDAAVDNLFYGNNVIHDVTYRYGFNEEAGNFQTTNYSGQGEGGDHVLAEAQDGEFVLNANFSTPPDGQSGRMQMFLWVDAFDNLGLGVEDFVRPYSHQVRDGDLDNGVIFHEYGHGISNRLVGGPSNVSCLRTHDEREGEGWSDWWSYVLTMRPGDDGSTPRGIGTYVVYHDEDGRSGPGIRITPYSTDMTINPSTYNTIKTAAEPHGVGYVWASMLWDLYWDLVKEHGFNPNPYDPWHTGGNNLAIQLSIDGMKFAPCEPGFADARDAIIAADAALTGDVANGIPGENECLIWRTFARRGLGVNASQGNFESKTDGINGFEVPAHCA